MSRLSRFLWKPLPTPEATVPPLWHAGLPVVVCWSPKAGCTTVLKWFLHHAGLLAAAEAHHPWPHRYRIEVLMHPLRRHLAGCRAAMRRTDVEVVKVVRDPAHRAVSAFLHAVRHEGPDWNTGVSEWKRRVGLQGQPGLSFQQFLQFVIDTRAAGRWLDFHFQPQARPCWDRLVDHVIPLEGLAQGLAEVERRHGLVPADVERLSRSEHHAAAGAVHRWPGDVVRFAATATDLRTLGTPPPPAFLDDRTLGLVRLAYREDYAAHGDLYPAPRAAEPRCSA